MKPRSLSKSTKLRYVPPPVELDSEDEHIEFQEEDEYDFGILDLSSLSLTSGLGSSLADATEFDDGENETDDDQNFARFPINLDDIEEIEVDTNVIDINENDEENVIFVDIGNIGAEAIKQTGEVNAAAEEDLHVISINNSEKNVKEEEFDDTIKESFHLMHIPNVEENNSSNNNDVDVNSEELFEDETEPTTNEEQIDVEETANLPRRSTRQNKGKTSKFEDFEQDLEQLLDLGTVDLPYRATPVNSDLERSLDWDNYASDPSFVNRVPVIVGRRITRSFNVDDLEISSDTTTSSVFDINPVQVAHPDEDIAAAQERNPNENDDHYDLIDDHGELPPVLPPRRRRSASVMVCSSATCKPKHLKPDGNEKT